MMPHAMLKDANCVHNCECYLTLSIGRFYPNNK